ncbi:MULTISPECIES: hypothetical protein [unclassified Enterococcus]|uniref:hypothetical protein n=1 Tax=unclassified Enterococcus TaxID=2608891 RepID=UPI001906D81D|nr:MULTISPECIES: hypothetical protein [unclassified Enterococcus]MBK0036667.1 hypothetical protein [Enterococcus sp. S52]MBK0069330.1 hypothetical protein [Enterococcus sp. S53]MBK0139923.1 hypothetical protein [Enterococcus sp. S76]MBK0143618.1 hypothetical protein [Enterococcus sp. S77]
MSLTNEQRAHDLAIAVAKDILKNPSYLQSEETKNFYAIYLTAYKQCLTNINADFPETETPPKS